MGSILYSGKFSRDSIFADRLSLALMFTNTCAIDIVQCVCMLSYYGNTIGGEYKEMH